VSPYKENEECHYCRENSSINKFNVDGNL